MAEAWARKLANSILPELDIVVCSAGLEAQGLNSRAVSAMRRQGIDISAQTSKLLTDDSLQEADLVVTVCSHADSHCPSLPMDKKKMHIPFPDPAKFEGCPGDIDSRFDDVCLQIKESVGALLRQIASEAS